MERPNVTDGPETDIVNEGIELMQRGEARHGVFAVS